MKVVVYGAKRVYGSDQIAVRVICKSSMGPLRQDFLHQVFGVVHRQY